MPSGLVPKFKRQHGGRTSFSERSRATRFGTLRISAMRAGGAGEEKNTCATLCMAWLPKSKMRRLTEASVGEMK